MVTDSHRVVPDRHSPLRDRCLGAVFLVAELTARCWVLGLFFRCYLPYNWLWRPSAAERVATVRPARGIDWHSDVRTLDGIFLRRDEQNVEGTDGNPPKLIR